MIKLKNILLEGMFVSDTKMKSYETLISKSIIDFMSKKYGINSKIIVKKKENPNISGDIVLNNNSLNKDKFYLHFNPTLSFPGIIKVLIHELTHVKQISREELTVSTDWKTLLWKNKPIIKVLDYKKIMTKNNTYKNLPWEKEAYANMDSLYKPFLTSQYWKDLKGKNPNLDYIIDNI